MGELRPAGRAQTAGRLVKPSAFGGLQVRSRHALLIELNDAIILLIELNDAII
jgi:hypothetical protein